MFPLSDENPTLRTPVVTLALLVSIGAVWALVQGAGFDSPVLVESLCRFGLIPGEVTHRLSAGTRVPLGEDASCLIQAPPHGYITLFTSMFLHGSWAHLISNAWFFWVFGNNVEDSMGRVRFLAFYLLCGLLAAVAQVAADPAAAAPMIGASGAISGVMGAYLVLYPHIRVKTLLFIVVFVRIIQVPAWLMLVYWFVIQLVTAGSGQAASSGVAVLAHIGGFIAGCVLVIPFQNPTLVEART